MAFLEAYTGSALYRRIKDTTLKGAVELAAREATALLKTVAQVMPLYTLHDERHILNVVSWMEELLGGAGIANLSELECTLALLAAYIHDLGMTLGMEEKADIVNDADYLGHRDRFSEETILIDRLHSQGDYHRAALIENHIITDYIRSTHAGQPAGRMAARLRQVIPRLIFGNVDLTFRLELLALSHNHPAEWLRLEFERRQLRWHMSINGQYINFPFLGILLRLADILDFDSSRTPTILFRHLGLDRPLANRFESLSAGEWKKHLAITDAAVSRDGTTVTYSSDACPDPVTHKSILHFIGVIEDELRRSIFELQPAVDAVPADRSRLAIRLAKVEHSIHPNIDVLGNPAYAYHDWSFRLDQDEIIRLLMGETLYGDPNLCIRELLQNSLDALDLRDLRLKAKEKSGRCQAVDGFQTHSGFFRHNGPEQELAATLSWGEQNGMQFLKVVDNGVGMTLQTIEHYFTQIGKSFYKSPDFSAEQAEFRRLGFISTPISQFGIGILSCFMIADRLSVRTNPGGGQPATNLEISGPGSLFWTSPGSLDYEGTEITLWLRSTHRVPMNHDRETIFRSLRDVFGYSGGKGPSEDQRLDPGFIAATHVVWPRFPVHIAPPGQPCWTINDRFHLEQLAPIDPEEFNRKLVEWDYPEEPGNEPCWQVWDWEDIDNGRPEPSGTRLRIWRPVQPTPTLEWLELNALVEPQVKQQRPIVLAQSMFVEDVDRILKCIPCAAEVGCRVWIDLRGGAAPLLTADRKTARSVSMQTMTATWESMISRLAENPELLLRVSLRPEFHSRARDSDKAMPCAGQFLRSTSEPRRLRLANAALKASLGRDSDSDRPFARDLVRDPDLVRGLADAFAFVGNIDLSLARARDLARAHAHRNARALAVFLGLARPLARNVFSSGFFRDVERARFSDFASDEPALYASFLQEAFFPHLTLSWPPFGLQALHGKIGDAVLTAPGEFAFQLDGRHVLFADQSASSPDVLSRRGYDICFPMSAIPLGRLRREFPQWREDRRYRPLGVLPLLSESSEVWEKYCEGLSRLFAPLESLYALQPARSLWYKPFAEWTRDDWQHDDHKSILWNIHTGEVTTYPGVRNRPGLAIEG